MVLVLTILLTFTVPSLTSAESNLNVEEAVRSIESVSSTLPENVNEDDLIRLFSAVEKMPLEIIESGNMNQIRDYLADEGVDLEISTETNADEDNSTTIQPFGFWSCVGTITILVGSAALGAGLLLKLKNFIAAAGGIKAAASALILLAQNQTAKALEEFGSAVVSLGGAILGISDIRKNCF